MVDDDEVRGMIRAYSQDLEVFSKAKKALQRRVLELEGDPHYDSFVNWAGTQAAVNVLIMCEARCQGIVEDLKNNIKEPGTVIRLVPTEEEPDEQPH